jgi:hypothetical protein
MPTGMPTSSDKLNKLAPHHRTDHSRQCERRDKDQRKLPYYKKNAFCDRSPVVSPPEGNQKPFQTLCKEGDSHDYS